MKDTKWLIAREIPYLRRYAIALLRDPDAADDLVQDCLERALNKHRLWHRRGRLRNWLYRMLYNLYLNQAKDSRRARYVSAVENLEDHFTQPARQETFVECRDMAHALSDLPDEQRAALVLVAVDGRAYEEAAWIMGVPVGTVRSRLFRARESLRKRMDSGQVRRLRRVK